MFCCYYYYYYWHRYDDYDDKKKQVCRPRYVNDTYETHKPPSDYMLILHNCFFSLCFTYNVLKNNWSTLLWWWWRWWLQLNNTRISKLTATTTGDGRVIKNAHIRRVSFYSGGLFPETIPNNNNNNVPLFCCLVNIVDVSLS